MPFYKIAEMQQNPSTANPQQFVQSAVGEFMKAAIDPGVDVLKATVYRTDSSSATLEALVQAAEEGKQAVCLVELKARFDERRNIEWARSLESAGVHVVYGIPSLKIHAKGTLVVRREEDGLRRYAQKRAIPEVLNGLGVSILSTSQGLMADREARAKGVGGEVLCTVW